MPKLKLKIALGFDPLAEMTSLAKNLTHRICAEGGILTGSMAANYPIFGNRAVEVYMDESSVKKLEKGCSYRIVKAPWHALDETIPVPALLLNNKRDEEFYFFPSDTRVSTVRNAGLFIRIWIELTGTLKNGAAAMNSLLQF